MDRRPAEGIEEPLQPFLRERGADPLRSIKPGKSTDPVRDLPDGGEGRFSPGDLLSVRIDEP